ncbi:MAG: hypothetical protein VX608_05220 [Chloroflexota bacterium]|nr:hypothetical protein [Chloroflexota bacterium]
MTLTVEAYSPNAEVLVIRNRVTGHNSHIKRIQFKSIVEVQRVNDMCHVQHEVETLPTVLAIL